MSSCGGSAADKYLGTWEKSDGATLSIEPAGKDTYVVRYRTARDQFGLVRTSNQTVTYEKGNLVSENRVICAYANGKIIYEGSAFEKIDDY